MECTCGHRFEFIHKGRATPEFRAAFALLPNGNYRKFLRSELKALEAKTDEAKYKALGKSASLVGCLTQCPKCKRLLLQRPDSGKVEYFVAEKRAARAKSRKRHSRT